ncbi:MAG: hypothetical protein NVSMB44_23600 [Ktedonobacteraceae bacterium]
MSVTPSSHVIGMFTERAAADNAVEELHRSGFEDERIRYSTPGTSGGFFEDLKSLFTGVSAEATNLTHDLVNMGLSNEQAQRYADEYNNGNTILVVNAPGREEQVLSILHQYGAYSAHSTGVQFGGSNPPVSPVQQTADNVELNDYPGSDPELQSHTHDPQAEVPITHEPPLEDYAQETTTPFIPLPDVEEQPTQPVTSAYAPESQHATNGSQASEHNAENGMGTTNPADLATPEHELATPAAEAPVSTPANELEDQAAQPISAIAEHETHDQATEPVSATTVHTHEEQAAPSSFATMEHALPGDQAAETSTAAYEERTENQMAEPVSIAPEHEIAAEDAPHASTTEHAPEHRDDLPGYSEYNVDEHRDPQDSVMMSEPATSPQTEQPAATILQHETIEHPVAHDDTAAPTLETPGHAVAHESAAIPEQETSEQSVVHESTMTPEQETVTQPEVVRSSTSAVDPEATEPLVARDSTSTHEPETVAAQPEPAQSSIPASISEAPVTQPALSSASMPDYASKLQRMQEQLQASQQQLQEAKARLQSAKEHETQIQATREQLLAIQKELEATQAELHETHSRIDQY